MYFILFLAGLFTGTAHAQCVDLYTGYIVPCQTMPMIPGGYRRQPVIPGVARRQMVQPAFVPARPAHRDMHLVRRSVRLRGKLERVYGRLASIEAEIVARQQAWPYYPQGYNGYGYANANVDFVHHVFFEQYARTVAAERAAVAWQQEANAQRMRANYLEARIAELEAAEAAGVAETAHWQQKAADLEAELEAQYILVETLRTFNSSS